MGCEVIPIQRPGREHSKFPQPTEGGLNMNITIKPLTPELADDYFDFFENRAFTDDSPYRCYCQVYQMSKEQYQAGLEYAKQDPGRASREVAEQQIVDGILRGYLAYVDGKSIGWCNANDRASYPAEPIKDVPFHAPAKLKEKAVVCFEIAPDYRGKGIATALLEQVIADAKTEGYVAVVSFPEIRTERYEWDTQGPIRLYEKAGFSKVSEKDGKAVMRKELK
jgi:GNAT superfamily N-acetyltransferase